MTCKVCNHSRIGEIEGLIRADKLTIQDASRELGCSYQEAWKHFNKCLTAPGDADEFEGHLLLLKELVRKLKARVDDLDETPTTIVSVKMLTSLVKELRGLIRDLGALEGRLQSGALIQLTSITVKYEKLASVMFSNLCDECRSGLIVELEQLEKLDDPRKLTAPTR